jgi:hypothetical protein
MDESTARRTIEALLASYRRFNGLANDVFSEGSYPQAREFRKLAGHIMGSISVGFFTPLFQQFPALEPTEFKGAYQPPPRLPPEKALEIGAALEELASRLSFIEAAIRAAGTPAELQAAQSEIADLLETIRAGRAFVERAARQPETSGA